MSFLETNGAIKNIITVHRMQNAFARQRKTVTEECTKRLLAML